MKRIFTIILITIGLIVLKNNSTVILNNENLSNVFSFLNISDDIKNIFK